MEGCGKPPLLQLVIEETTGRIVGIHPVAPEQEVVDVVREDQLFERHALRPQPLNQIRGLGEVHVAIIIAVDQQHWRLPFIHR